MTRSGLPSGHEGSAGCTRLSAAADTEPRMGGLFSEFSPGMLLVTPQARASDDHGCHSGTLISGGENRSGRSRLEREFMSKERGK